MGMGKREEKENAARGVTRCYIYLFMVVVEKERMASAMRLSRGFCFNPRESDLIEYLQDKVEGRPDAGQGVIKDDVDVYGCNPEQLLGDSIMHDDGRSFFFTPIKNRNANGRDRSTPNGCWNSRNKKAPIRNGEGSPMGYVQVFQYHHGKKKSERTKWRMKEYTLNDDQPKMALCVIYRAHQIQGNELRINPLKLQEAMDSECEDTGPHYPPNEEREGPSGGTWDSFDDMDFAALLAFDAP